MSNAKYIIELAKRQMSLDGYDFIVSIVKQYLNTYNWPKTILDENTNLDTKWSDDEVLSFTQQLLVYVLDKEKLKNYYKIPENYIEYYFKTIIVSYVANKIKVHQNKLGLSFDDTKRISLEILNDQYFSKEYADVIIWNKENSFINPVLENDSINEIVSTLPKIPITEKTKHYKPRVKTAIIDVFNLVNRPVKQNILINQIFKLFDQSSFAVNNDKQSKNEIRNDLVLNSILAICNRISRNDIPIYIDYFFNDSELSLNLLAVKYNLPKSTVHYKTSQFSKIITDCYMPNNDEEGIWFLENLHKTLDEMK